MAQGAAAMAGGQPQGMPPVQATPGQVSGGDPQKIKMALEAAIKQSVNQQGYVDMNKLVQVWPQISQSMGINIPFQTVLQMIQQDPTLVEQIINQMGLAGIIVNGKMISAEQLLAQSQSGGASTPAGPAVGGTGPSTPQAQPAGPTQG